MSLKNRFLNHAQSKFFFQAVLVGAGYFLLGWLGLHFATINNNASPIWPATGFAIALATRWKFPAVIGIFFGALATNITVGTPTLALIAMAVGNTLEAVIGSYLYKKFSHEFSGQNHTKILPLLLVSLFAPMISALMGVGSLYALHIIPASQLGIASYTWWSGDAIGFFCLFPLLNGDQFKKEDCPWRESLRSKFIGSSIAVSIFGLIYFTFTKNFNQAVLWSVIPLIVLTNYYFSIVITHLILLATFSLAIGLVKNEFGPLEYGSPNLNLIYLQTWIFSASLSVLFSFSIACATFRFRRRLIVFGALWLSLLVMLGYGARNESRLIANDLDNTFAKSLETLANFSKYHEQVLNGAEALKNVKTEITPYEWKSFFDAQFWTDTYTSLNGVGFIKYIKNSKIAAFEAQTQKQYGDQSFKIKTLDPNYSKSFDDSFVIQMIHPLEKNKQALGLNIGSESSRRKGAEEARLTDKIRSTAPIQLVQDYTKRPGVLLLNPVYKGNRKANKEFMGWVYAPVILETFFRQGLSTYLEGYRFKVNYQNQVLFNGNRYLESGIKKNIYLRQKNFDFFGLGLELSLYPGDTFFMRHSSLSVVVSALVCIFALLLLAFLSHQVGEKERAEKLIEQRSAELTESKFKLAQASKMSSLGEMAAGIAHEINNPLAILEGRASLIKRKLGQPEFTTDILSEEIDKIIKTTHRIAQIIKGLKTFSRSAENDPMEFVRISAIAQDTLAICRERMFQAGIELKVDVNENIIIPCRSAEISQVLLNLLNNSYDAIVNLEERWIEIKTITVGQFIQIVVTDSGRGIAPSTVDKMMNPFFTTKPVGKGTGLGLSVSKGIIENHGGRFWYDEKSANTRFVIEIPQNKIDEDFFRKVS